MTEHKDIQALQRRVNEQYLADYRNARIDTFSDWKNRIREADALVRGDWTVVFPGEINKSEKPMVMNLGESMLRDISRLVAEIEPAPRAQPKSDNEDDQKNAWVREAIVDTHWEWNRGALMVPQLAMDLIHAGGAFVVAWVDDESDHPRFMRVDPRHCYPDIHNGMLQDLLVVQRIKLRVLDNLFPGLGILTDTQKMKDVSDHAEVWDYYSKDECLKAVSLIRKDNSLVSEGGVYIVKRWNPDISLAPVAFAQLPTHDGAFRGMLDQIGGSLLAKNKTARLMVQYVEQQVYAPFAAKGVINATDPPGPNTIYQLDPNMQDSRLERVPPAGSSPQLFALLQYLDDQQRGQLAYPPSRQGEVSQSIASAAFVSSTQGQLTSVVREIQKLQSDLRQQLARITFELDEEHKDFEKPLIRSIGKKTRYSPKRDINGQYHVQIVYGAGAGLDRANADVRVLQHVGAGLISKETAREQIDYLRDPEGESDKLEREATAGAILQTILADPNVPFDIKIDIFASMRKDGLSLADAVVAVRERAAAAAERQAEGGEAGGVPAPEAGLPAEAGEERLALEKGAVPGQEVEFAPPLLEQVIVRGGV